MIMMDRTCKKCGHLCHCIEADHEGCKCTGCDCKISIHELAKANPNKTYRELEQERAEQDTYETNGGVVIDDTNECESCQ